MEYHGRSKSWGVLKYRITSNGAKCLRYGSQKSFRWLEERDKKGRNKLSNIQGGASEVTPIKNHDSAS